VEGIYTGYSANGSYCFIPVLNGGSKDFVKVVGHVFGYGFPILETPPCGEKWNILVTKKQLSKYVATRLPTVESKAFHNAE